MMDLENAWLVNGRDVPIPSPVQCFGIPHQECQPIKTLGGSEIFAAFEYENVLNQVIMDMSKLLQSNPRHLIQKLIIARKVAEHFDVINEDRTCVSFDMYSDLQSKHKKIGDRSLSIYTIPRSSVFWALVVFTNRKTLISFEEVAQLDYLEDKETLPIDVSDDRQKQIQYARQLWNDLESECRKVWHDDGWNMLVNEMNQQAHPIFNFFPKPIFYFDEKREREIYYYPSMADYYADGNMTEEDAIRQNIVPRDCMRVHDHLVIVRDLPSLLKHILIGSHWFEIGDSFCAVTSGIIGKDTVMIENGDEVRSLALSSSAVNEEIPVLPRNNKIGTSSATNDEALV